MRNEIRNTLKEIREKQKKMTRVAVARIMNESTERDYSVKTDSTPYKDTIWAKYEFEVDGKTYTGHDEIGPIHGKTCKILYNPEDPSQNRSKWSRAMRRIANPFFSMGLALVIFICILMLVHFFG